MLLLNSSERRSNKWSISQVTKQQHYPVHWTFHPTCARRINAKLIDLKIIVADLSVPWWSQYLHHTTRRLLAKICPCLGNKLHQAASKAFAFKQCGANSCISKLSFSNRSCDDSCVLALGKRGIFKTQPLHLIVCLREWSTLLFEVHN